MYNGRMVSPLPHLVSAGDPERHLLAPDRDGLAALLGAGQARVDQAVRDRIAADVERSPLFRNRLG